MCFFGFSLVILLVWAILLTRAGWNCGESLSSTMFFRKLSAHIEERGAQLHYLSCKPETPPTMAYEGMTWFFSIGAVVAGIFWAIQANEALRS